MNLKALPVERAELLEAEPASALSIPLNEISLKVKKRGKSLVVAITYFLSLVFCPLRANRNRILICFL